MSLFYEQVVVEMPKVLNSACFLGAKSNEMCNKRAEPQLSLFDRDVGVNHILEY